MSEYLSRLATRARESDERQLLRPFVRSSSPIATHDQRIGMTATEGFESVGAPPDQTRSESTAGSLGEFETGSRPGIEPGNGMGETIVQRKMAATTVGKTGPSPYDTPAGPRANNEWMSSGIHTPTLEIPGSKTLPSPGATEVKTRIAELAPSSGAGVFGVTNDNESHEPSAPHDATSIKLSSGFPEMSAGDSEPSVSARASARPDTRRSESLGTHATTRQVGQISVPTRSVRQESGIDSPRLEPKFPVFVDRFEPSPGDSAASSAAADESPRLVIGRINVEVVPPAAPQVATVPRPRPLTAASVSVIGPLSGVRPNVRLSLRYR